MATTANIKEIITELTSGNSLYNKHIHQWTYLLESYLGGEDYRRGGHLTRYAMETDEEYAARLRATPLDNHCHSVISVYNSFLFREKPQRNFNGLERQSDIEDFLKDADLDGRSLDSFMKEVSTWSSVFGHCWIMVTKPNVGAVTRADELQIGLRPYLTLLTPLSVLDWSWTRTSTGRYVLDYIKYIEDINGDVRVIKEWWNDRIVTTIVNTANSTVNNETVEINQLDFIPAVIAYNGKSLYRGIGISDIVDIADVQKFIYNATSEIDQSIRMDSHPSLVTTPETQIGTGSGALIRMPENIDPGLKPYVLDFGGADTNNILNTIKHYISAIDKMANTGAVRANEVREMSGVAMQTEFQLLNARLSEKADNLELAEEQIWRLWAIYAGTVWTGEIVYPGSFNIKDVGSEFAQLKTAREAASDSRVWNEIDNLLLRELGIGK